MDLVKSVGYTNVNKGLRWLDGIERGHDAFPPLAVLRRFAERLELSQARLAAAMKADFDALDAVPEYSLVERLTPAVYRSLELPAGLSVAELEDYATVCARDRGREVCLSLSPVRRLYVDSEGRRSTSLGLGGPSSTLTAVLSG